MNDSVAALEQVIAKAAVEQLPILLGELERVKMLAWHRLIGRSENGQGPGSPRQLLTISEVAARLSIPESRAYELARQRGGLPTVRIGKYVRVDPVALDGWIAKSKRGT